MILIPQGPPMEEPVRTTDLTLVGGPLHQLGRRVGLVRGTTTVPLGIALGVSAWGVLVVLALLEGLGPRILSLSVIGTHVRLLVAIPLFFVCETWWNPVVTAFVREIVQSGVVPVVAIPSLESDVTRANRWTDSWLVEVMCLALVLLSPLAARLVHLPGATAVFEAGPANAGMTFAAWWYWIVCLPLFRFLLFRWLFRLAIWGDFLRRLARLDLHLVPTHPDGVAGLGYLEVVHTHFPPLVVAFSAVLSASFAEGISTGTMAFAEVYPATALILILDAVLFLGPLLLFASRLWTCRVEGLRDYMVLASGYVSGFDRKWVRGERAPEEALLGTPDLQSLADLSNSVAVVRNMRTIPASQRLIATLVAAAIVPLLPLLLLKYPVADLVGKIFGALTGL
jgi:hypothetical protein